VSTLILLRHGQSQWNLENLFTGWIDVDLTPQGEDEARGAGRLLADEGLLPEVVHTSVQVRAIRTANLTLDVCRRSWIPVRRSWRLNERHYGALQGKNKKETTEQFGPEQVLLWRRSYDVRPPPLTDDTFQLRHDSRYRDLAPDVIPDTECLKDVVARMLPYWYDDIVPDLRAGLVTLVAAHGNSLRALVKHLEGIADEDIAELNIPTGVPRIYELGKDLRPVAEARQLGDPDEIARKAAEVARQAGGEAAVGPSDPNAEPPAA
jgi:2,3-bisphosphoglycerate-dependent phosphoglycerate mutase